MQDPLYTKIVAALRIVSDRDQFELCAADLLRDAFPDLVPVTGGSDDGVDGVFGDDGALVCTTGSDVIGNVTASLTRHRDTGGRRRRIVVATSQELSPRRKRNLETRAGELGFTLVQAFDQPAIALRLLRDARWRLSLLGIAGDLEVLSKTSPRPSIATLEVIERRESEEWLRATPGDRLLVGGPGSGKTTLFEQLVAVEGNYYFLTGADETAIADAVRSRGPAAVVVDDAHFDIQLVRLLGRVRRELRAEFAIVASVWHGGVDELRSELNLPAERVHELPPMPRDALVRIVKAMGIGGPIELIRRIVDQSANQPGLAVILSQATLQGDGGDVVTGRSLRRYVLMWLRRVAPADSAAILGAFALGGRSGMDPDRVAAVLGLSLIAVRAPLRHALAAGIMRESSAHRIAVRTRALRGALVDEAFFSPTGPRLDYRPLLEVAPDRDSSVETILWAANTGARVDDAELRTLVAASDSTTVRASYAALGATEARWVLAAGAADDPAVVSIALLRIPDDAIPLLLDRIAGDSRLPHSAPGHPLRVLEDWVSEIEVSAEASLERRRILITSVRKWQRSGGDSASAVRAACLALSPDYRDAVSDPGRGNIITIRFGVVSSAMAHGIAALWPQVREVIEHQPGAGWSAVLESLWQCEHPGASGPAVDVPTQTIATMRSLGREILGDLAAMVKSRPGLLATLRAHAETLDYSLPDGTDTDFAVLFPREPRSADEWEATQAIQVAAVRSLAAAWQSLPALWIAERLAYLEGEATVAGINYPRFTPLLCRALATAHPEATELYAQLLLQRTSPDLLEPFVSAFAGEGKVKAIDRLLNRDDTHQLAVAVALEAEVLPDELRTTIEGQLAKYTHLVYVLSLRQRIPEERMIRLLHHPDRSVALAAAVGEWAGTERGSVRPALRDAFREAVVRTADLPRHVIQYDSSAEHWLEEILRRDPALAYEWLYRRLERGQPDYFLLDHSPQVGATSVLSDADRRALLSHPRLPEAGGEMTALLVSDDAELYAQVLAKPELAAHHLAPLAGDVSEHWMAKARLALRFGCFAEDVVAAVLGNGFTISGSAAQHWAKWRDTFAAFEHDPDNDARTLAAAGVRHFDQLRQRAADRERQEELAGLDGEA